MSASFNVTIISPDKTIYTAKVISLTAPCESGYWGVLADHAPLTANLAGGEITIRKDLESQPEVFYCKGRGFLEVLNNNVSLLFSEDFV